MAIGQDIGTAFLCSARQDDNNSVQIKIIRDAFLDLDNDPQVKNMLKMSNTDCIEAGDKLYIIGDPALVLANIFKKEARRPLSQGVISPGELEAERVLSILLDNVMGKAKNEGETCFFSVPAPAIDKPMDVIYHQAIFSKLVSSKGYFAKPLNEAAAIVFSNAAKERFSALAISCLTPGQKIITDRGFVSIEDIKEGDKVLNKDGVWAVCSPTYREYKGKVYEIIAYGNGKVEVTEDHKIWIKRDEEWFWCEAKDVKIGDLVSQPWPNYEIQSTGPDTKSFVDWMESPTISSSKSYNYGHSVSKINAINIRDYEGTVYDVSVVDGKDKSFCVPGITVHNCGAGMINVCLMYKTVIGMAFSVSRGGDWIDLSAARACGVTASKIVATKEKGTDLMDITRGDSKNLREREAIQVYYKSLVMYALDSIKNEFMRRQQGMIELPNAIPIILSGGTALAKNFKEFFEEGFKAIKDFPIAISEIRLANDPLHAVAKGLLVAALNYDEGEESA